MDTSSSGEESNSSASFKARCKKISDISIKDLIHDYQGAKKNIRAFGVIPSNSDHDGESVEEETEFDREFIDDSQTYTSFKSVHSSDPDYEPCLDEMEKDRNKKHSSSPNLVRNTHKLNYAESSSDGGSSGGSSENAYTDNDEVEHLDDSNSTTSTQYIKRNNGNCSKSELSDGSCQSDKKHSKSKRKNKDQYSAANFGIYDSPDYITQSDDLTKKSDNLKVPMFFQKLHLPTTTAAANTNSTAKSNHSSYKQTTYMAPIVIRERVSTDSDSALDSSDIINKSPTPPASPVIKKRQVDISDSDSESVSDDGKDPVKEKQESQNDDNAKKSQSDSTLDSLPAKIFWSSSHADDEKPKVSKVSVVDTTTKKRKKPAAKEKATSNDNDDTDNQEPAPKKVKKHKKKSTPKYSTNKQDESSADEGVSNNSSTVKMNTDHFKKAMAATTVISSDFTIAGQKLKPNDPSPNKYIPVDALKEILTDSRIQPPKTDVNMLIYTIKVENKKQQAFINMFFNKASTKNGFNIYKFTVNHKGGLSPHICKGDTTFANPTVTKKKKPWSNRFVVLETSDVAQVSSKVLNNMKEKMTALDCHVLVICINKVLNAAGTVTLYRLTNVGRACTNKLNGVTLDNEEVVEMLIEHMEIDN